MNKETVNFGPVWAEIDLDKVIYNVQEIRNIIDKDTLLTGVVKANAYGHGSVMIAKTLVEDCSIDKLAVANIREGIELRQAKIDSDIIILGFTQKSDLYKVVNYNFIQTVYTLEQAKMLSEIGKKNEKVVRIHLKLDTGLSRIGFLNTKETIDDIIKIGKLSNIEIEGTFTHLATADSVDKSFCKVQVQEYLELIDNLEIRGVDMGIKHVSNTAAIIDLPEYNFDMVKTGIALYGLYPSKEVNHDRIKLKPIMELKTKISHLKELKEGTGISYGQKYRTKDKEIIATIPIGYADGLSRLLSNTEVVGVSGSRARIVGNICMDQTMINVTGISDVKIEDEVVLISNGEKNYPIIDDIADNIGTINYEIATLIGRRIPRVYKKDGEVIKIVDYLCD